MLHRIGSRTLLVLALAMLAVPAAARAQQTGRIVGRIVDGSGQPLVGAQIEVVGTGLGTLSGVDGRYAVQGVPVGQRSLRSSA